MLRGNEATLHDDSILYGNYLYTPLYRKSNDRKRAREISRDIARPVIKKRRQSVDRPFRQGPSGEQRKSRASNFLRGTGRGAITKKQMYFKCEHTNSNRTNVESNEGSLQSPSKHIENLKLQSLFVSYWEKKHNNLSRIKGVQKRNFQNSKFKVCPSHKLLGIQKFRICCKQEAHGPHRLPEKKVQINKHI